jgi:hypothetical protein
MSAAAETSEVPGDGTVYRVRAHAFVKRRTYRLLDDALAWEEDGAKPDGVLYRDIAEVRLAYAPTRAAINRYRAQVIFRQGGMAQIFNQDYRGFADFQDQNADYVAFIKELHRRIAASGGETTYRAGSSRKGYVFNMALSIGALITFAAIAVFVLNFGASAIVWAKFAIILPFIPILFRYMKTAKPVTYDPAHIPENVLPEQ